MSHVLARSGHKGESTGFVSALQSRANGQKESFVFHVPPNGLTARPIVAIFILYGNGPLFAALCGGLFLLPRSPARKQNNSTGRAGPHRFLTCQGKEDAETHQGGKETPHRGKCIRHRDQCRQSEGDQKARPDQPPYSGVSRKKKRQRDNGQVEIIDRRIKIR